MPTTQCHLRVPTWWSRHPTASPALSVLISLLQHFLFSLSLFHCCLTRLSSPPPPISNRTAVCYQVTDVMKQATEVFCCSQQRTPVSSFLFFSSAAKKMMSLVSGHRDADSTASSSSLSLRARKSRRKLYRPEISSPMDVPPHPVSETKSLPSNHQENCRHKHPRKSSFTQNRKGLNGFDGEPGEVWVHKTFGVSALQPNPVLWKEMVAESSLLTCAGGLKWTSCKICLSTTSETQSTLWTQQLLG